MVETANSHEAIGDQPLAEAGGDAIEGVAGERGADVVLVDLGVCSAGAVGERAAGAPTGAQSTVR
jgi:hypothetical protein